MYNDKGKQKALLGKTEWDVLKENHRFIREDEDAAEVSWEERLARAYESKLFKEYALVDLKHYKSAKIALRWRTAPEVVNGIGENSCASLRCPHHQPVASGSSPSSSTRSPRGDRDNMPPLIAYELPFVYQEAGERKEALVKVKVCSRCSRKLLWGKGGQDKDKDVHSGAPRSKRQRHEVSDDESGEKRRQSRRSRSR